MTEHETDDQPPTFAVGDVVRLKSGGFPMTVAILGLSDPYHPDCDMYSFSDEVICYWHDASGVPHKKRYQVRTLIKATATEVPVESAFDTLPAKSPWRDRRGL